MHFEMAAETPPEGAAFRAVDTALPHLKPGASLMFAFLPDGLDPDDLVRQQGAAALDACLGRARPLVDVLFEREWGQGDWSTPERRAGLEKTLKGLIGRVAVLGRAMREEAIFLEGPQRQVDRRQALVRPRLHHRTPAALKRFLNEAWQHLFQGLLLEVIKKYLGRRGRIRLAHAGIIPVAARVARRACLRQNMLRRKGDLPLRRVSALPTYRGPERRQTCGCRPCGR